MTHFYSTIDQEARAEHKDRGSRFLAFLFPISTVDDFKKRLKQLKEEHLKAAHHCFAYRLGTDGTAYRASDDGEPAGTAGKPMLGQLDSKGVTNAAVVVVRYFGGTLLGVPGLIAAYKTATALALQLTSIVQKPILLNYQLQFDYTLLNDVMLLVKHVGGTVQQQELQLFCRMVVGVPVANESVFSDKLKNLHAIEAARIVL